MHTAYYPSFFLGSRFFLGNIAEFVQRPSISSHNINSAYQPPRNCSNLFQTNSNCQKVELPSTRAGMNGKNWRFMLFTYLSQNDRGSAERAEIFGFIHLICKFASCCLPLWSTISAYPSWRWWILTSQTYLPRDNCAYARGWAPNFLLVIGKQTIQHPIN